MKKTKKIRKPVSTTIFNGIGYTYVVIMAVVCIVPFIMLISGSFSSEDAILQNGYKLWPQDFSVAAYQAIFLNLEGVLRAYGVTIFITVGGTLISVFMLTMAAFVLSSKNFKYRYPITFFFYFTTLFNGGMMSTYIFMIRYYGMKNNLLALILPLAVNVFYLLIMRNFMQAIPDSLFESAHIDGANDFIIYLRIALPLAKAGIATVALFVALGYWNDWYNAMLFIADSKKWPLQYMLYNMLMTAQGVSKASGVGSSMGVASLPTNTMKLAMAVVATGPILVVYPFVQRYFVKGVTVGAVKG